MSYMKGNLFSKTKKLVQGMAINEPRWLKAMEEAPPPTFPRVDGKLKPIVLPEDKYVNIFLRRNPDAKFFENSDNFNNLNPPPSQVFGRRVVEMKKQGVPEEEALAVADMEYQAERKAKEKAYIQLKKINELQGKNPPPNPYPKAAGRIMAEELKYIRAKYTRPRKAEILKELTMKKSRSEQ